MKIINKIQKSKQHRCPRCGYGKSDIDNQTASTILNNLEESTSNSIRNVYHLLKNNSNASKGEFFNFLANVMDVEEESIRRSCDDFVNKGYYLQGKGFHYLMAMAYRKGEYDSKRATIEELIHGEAPPISIWSAEKGDFIAST